MAAAYSQKLARLSRCCNATIPTDRDHVFMLYPLVVRDGNKRPLINFLEMNGIETRDLLPLLNQPVYRKLFGDLEPQYPVAQWLNRGGFYIGCHQYIDEAAIQYVTDKFCEYFEHQGRQAA